MGSLFVVRVLLGIAIISLAVSGFGQKLTGSYKPKSGAAVGWKIDHQALIWGEAPYLPVGIQVDGSPEAVQTAKDSGISDVIVDLPVTGEGWAPTLKRLEDLHMTYVIRISSLTQMANGTVVDPASYRISQANGPQHLSISLPGASDALIVAAQKRDGTVVKWAKAPVKDGTLAYDLDLPNGLDCVVLVYPSGTSLVQPDFWESLDAHRDHLLQALKANPTGPGLRGFVNPIGKTLALPNRDLKVIPNSPGFRSEFAAFLEQKYRNVVGVLTAWGLPTGLISANENGDDKNQVLSFQDVASFVPLWSGYRGIGQIYYPTKNELYSVDNLHSAIWKDVADAISIAEARRFQRIISAIRDIDDVPVAQEWEGWAVPYEGALPSVDGIGMKASGTSPSAIYSTAAKAASSDLRWTQPGWLPATEIDCNEADLPTEIPGITDDLISLGARGVFFHTSDSASMKAIAAEETKRKSDRSPAQGSPSVIYYPENATNPAHSQKLPGGTWWLPAPYDGERIDYGDGFYAYRMLTPGGTTLTIWSNKTQRLLLRLIDDRKISVRKIGEVSPDPKSAKNGVDITLSDTPIVISGLDEIPVPEPAYMQSMGEVLYLIDKAKTDHRDITQVSLELSSIQQGFDRNPGGQFTQLRKVLHAFDSFMGQYSWIEAERSGDNNFSEVADLPGSSGNRIIRLHPMLDATDSFYAAYDAAVYSKDEQEVWLAARVFPHDHSTIVVDLNGQKFTVSKPPIGLYGDGFGWYDLGITKNSVGSAHIKISVSGISPDIDADSILLAPVGFKPDGLTYPEVDVDLNAQKVRKPKPTNKPHTIVTTGN